MQSIFFSTPLHQQASEVIAEFFTQRADMDTVLITNSFARGKAVAQSDLDMVVLLKPECSIKGKEQVERIWQELRSTHPVLRDFLNADPFLQIHLDVITGQYEPQIWDDGGGPDYFEVEIGNQLLYSRPLSKPGNFFESLQEKWLPYYDDDLQQKRLQMVKQACLYDLDHIPFFEKRGLHFQAFDRLYKSFQQFLQALFISHKTYPLAYNKWIREQIEEILGLPHLYKQLPSIISLSNIESDEVNEKAKHLQALILRYIH